MDNQEIRDTVFKTMETSLSIATGRWFQEDSLTTREVVPQEISTVWSTQFCRLQSLSSPARTMPAGTKCSRGKLFLRRSLLDTLSHHLPLLSRVTAGQLSCHSIVNPSLTDDRTSPTRETFSRSKPDSRNVDPKGIIPGRLVCLRIQQSYDR